MNPDTQKPLEFARFVHELAQLGITPRSGWHHIGVDAENLSAHVLRAAQIAFILATDEGHENPHYVCTLAVFHEIAEARTGDADAVSKRYLKVDEEGAVRDQTAPLGLAGSAIFEMWKEVEEQSTPAGIIAKDADYLEMAFKARELMKLGHDDAAEWFRCVEPRLKTSAAQKLYEALSQVDPNDWWKTVVASRPE